MIKAVGQALREHIQKYALQYVVAFALACSASLQQFFNTFSALDRAGMDKLAWWQVLALIAGCLQPGLTALLGYLMRSPVTPAPTSTSTESKAQTP